MTLDRFSLAGRGRTIVGRARVPAPFLTEGVPVGAPCDPDGAALVDLVLADGTVVAITAAGEAGAPADIDLAGRHVWPTLVDAHAHLDKGHIVERAPNPRGDFLGAREATAADRTAHWRHADLMRRMTFGLRCAEAHGVGAIRTHLDSLDGQGETSWTAFRTLREAWAGRVALQAVALVPLAVYHTAYGGHLADLVADCEGLLGGLVMAQGGAPGALAEDLDALFAHARARDCDVDLHVDEASDSHTLRDVALATLRHGYAGRVTCGHCCSLATLPEAELAETLRLVAEAGITVVTLPTVNLYLQDRQTGRTPRWRGVTTVRELLAAGAGVVVAGDNCRDPFHAYGDHDMLDTFRQAVRILHLDHPIAGAAALVGPRPAALMGLGERVGAIRVGAPADLIVMNAWSMDQVVARPQSDRMVLRRGVPLDRTPPGYDELDG